MNWFRKLIVVSTVFCLIPLWTGAAEREYHVNIPRLPQPPQIDGIKENPLWKKAATLDSFTQYEPKEGAAPSEKTLVYMGYAQKNLYIAVRAFDSNPQAIRSCLTKRDEVHGDDQITFYFDTFRDRKKAFTFQVNPCGVQTDGVYKEMKRRRRGGGFQKIDKSWDTYFTTDARVDEKGYFVEMAIPFKSLRFPNRKTQLWGLQIKREIPRKNEEIYWYPRSRDVNGFLVQSGTLEISGDIEKGRNVEVLPVVTGRKERSKSFNPQAGLNLKYGVTSDMTLDFAYNPDFSQVEADMPQIDVNQRYDLYYPEKRPFFLEGKDIFDTPVELVYTRTIVNPQYGFKLTGKTGKYSIGVLSAYDETPPEINFSSQEDEPLAPSSRALVNVFRMKRDLFKESYVGFILTDKEAGANWGGLSENYNRVAGIDGHFKFNKYYRFTFQIMGSQSQKRNQKSGFIPAMNFKFNRNSRHWRLSAEYKSLPDAFEASTGFIRRRDIQSLSTRVSYAFLPQNKYIVDIRPSFEYKRIYNFDNTLTDEEFQVGGFISGWRGTFIYGGFTSRLERYEGIDFHKNSFRAHINSEPLSWLSGNISFSFGDGIYYSDNPYLGYKTSLGFRLTLKPLANLRAFYKFQNNRFFKEMGGEKVYDVNILSQRINFQFSRTLSLRLITDYNDYYKKLYNSILLSYVYNPGTVFYLGIDDNQIQDETGMYRIEGRYYFIKFSYWWRI